MTATIRTAALLFVVLCFFAYWQHSVAKQGEVVLQCPTGTNNNEAPRHEPASATQQSTACH